MASSHHDIEMVGEAVLGLRLLPVGLVDNDDVLLDATKQSTLCFAYPLCTRESNINRQRVNEIKCTFTALIIYSAALRRQDYSLYEATQAQTPRQIMPYPPCQFTPQ